MASPMFVHGLGTIRAIADALGLTDRKITSITIHANCKEATKVYVEIMQLDQQDQLCKVFKEYRLEPIEPPGAAISAEELAWGHQLDQVLIKPEPASEPKPRFREFT